MTDLKGDDRRLRAAHVRRRRGRALPRLLLPLHRAEHGDRRRVFPVWAARAAASASTAAGWRLPAAAWCTRRYCATAAMTPAEWSGFAFGMGPGTQRHVAARYPRHPLLLGQRPALSGAVLVRARPARIAGGVMPAVPVFFRHLADVRACAARCVALAARAADARAGLRHIADCCRRCGLLPRGGRLALAGRFYFTIITLSTVGYGDLAPQSDAAQDFHDVLHSGRAGILGSFIALVAEARDSGPTLPGPLRQMRSEPGEAPGSPAGREHPTA